MPINIVGRTDPESFTSNAFVGFGGRAIAYSPALGATANATGFGTIFRFNVFGFEDATEVVFAIYNATTRALLETISVTPAVGTGLQEIPMAGTTQFTSGEFYKIGVYNNAPSEQIRLATDPTSLQVGFIPGDSASPVDPIPAEPFTELFNNEFFWEVQGDDPPPQGGDGVLRDSIKPVVRDLI